MSALRLQKRPSAVSVCLAVILGIPAFAEAQTGVVLPSTTVTSTLTADVAEQAQVSVPASVSIAVNNVNAQSAQPNQAVSATNIVLATATKQLKVSIQANAATFTPPATATNTWNASDVSWTTTGGSPWTNATGTDRTLSHLSYNTVATCNAGATSSSTTRLKFNLASNANINRSGTHTLVIT